MSKFNKIFEARGGSSNSVNESDGKISEKTEEKNPPKKSKSAGSAGKKSNDGVKSVKTPQKREQTLKTTAEAAPHTSGSTLQTGNRKRGRPQAKRSDPNYLGFTTYIRRDTHLNAKIALLQEGKGRELSELVETLLTDWLKSKKTS